MSRRARKKRRGRALTTRSATGSFPHHRRLAFEALEDRRLLSASPGNEALQLFSTSTALFVENQGQWQDDSVRYGFNGPGVNIAFTDEGLKFLLTQRETAAEPALGEGDSPTVPGEENFVTQTAEFSVSFDGANVVTPVGLNEAETRFNYFVGDQANWRANVPGFTTVAYENLYNGIDLHTFGRRDSLKYEFHVDPGTDWRQIQVSYDGVQGLWIDNAGALHVETTLGQLVDDAPYIYQVVDGQQIEIAGSFRLIDADTYTFDVAGAYDANAELVIDPTLAWSSYLGGSSDDHGNDVAIDATGAVVVTGSTSTSGWVSGGYDTSFEGVSDAFVIKLSSSGTHIWSTYLGGSGNDGAGGVAVDANGAIIVAGGTGSSGWVSGGFDTTYNGDPYDAFVAKLSPSGGHLWSTYLGGSNSDYGYGVAVDAHGAIVVTGRTVSSGFVGDAFVAKLSASGGHLWSTYLGGSGDEYGYGVAADADGAIVVTGLTSSFGWVSGGFDTSYDTGADGFVAKLSPSGGHLWSTYLGGFSYDAGVDVAVDAGGAIVVTGQTESSGWVSSGFDTSFNGGKDTFVVKLSASGGHLWSTYLGGGGREWSGGVAVDADGAIVVTSYTESPGWVSGGFDTSYNGGPYDAFVAKLSPSGGHLWSTYLGGSNSDYGHGVALDAAGAIVVTGSTISSGWVSGGFDTSYNGNYDAFVARIDGVGAGVAPGVTIITHGWQAIGNSGDPPPDWTFEMATGILGRAGGVGSVFVHDNDPDHTSTFGEWIPLNDLGISGVSWANSNDPANETVLIYNWVWDSNDGEDGWLRAAADNLFASLLEPIDGFIGGQSAFDLAADANLLNFHFIGHSRGAVVNSLATNLLGYYFPGYTVDQVTTLDPHPILDEGWAAPFYDANDPEIYTYSNVRYADNYYRQDGSYQDDLIFDGKSVDGTHNIELNNSLLIGTPTQFIDGGWFLSGGEHTDTHLWYTATVAPNAGVVETLSIAEEQAAGWWAVNQGYSSSAEAASGRANIGYARTRIGGADRSGFQVTGAQAVVAPTEPIFNGGFGLGDSNNSDVGASDEIPGWERHGGLVDADLTTDGRLHLGEYLAANYNEIRHNPLYIPSNAIGLEFEYEITDASANDQLAVYVGATQIGLIALDTIRSQTATLPFFNLFQGKVDTIAFSLTNGLITSDVLIDNVRFVIGVPVLPGDYNANHVVDAADYVVWRKMQGINVSPYIGADGSGNGNVGPEDYGVWRAHFGETEPMGGGAGSGELTAIAGQPPAEPGAVGVAAVATSSGDSAQQPPALPGVGVVANVQADVIPARQVASLTSATFDTAGQASSGTHLRALAKPVAPEVSHDEALVAWLASRNDDGREEEEMDAGRAVGDVTARDATEDAFDAFESLDAAFGALVGGVSR